MAKFDLGKFLQIVGAIGPGVLLMVPGGEKIAPLVPVIIGAIGEAEQIKGATGAQKKDHVLQIVAAGVDVANATGGVTLDRAEVQTVAGQGIDAVIGTVHIVQGVHPKTTHEAAVADLRKQPPA